MCWGVGVLGEGRGMCWMGVGGGSALSASVLQPCDGESGLRDHWQWPTRDSTSEGGREDLADVFLLRVCHLLSLQLTFMVVEDLVSFCVLANCLFMLVVNANKCLLEGSLKPSDEHLKLSPEDPQMVDICHQQIWYSDAHTIGTLYCTGRLCVPAEDEGESEVGVYG